MPIDEQAFKQAMSQWSSGVTVVTTRLEDGTLHGLTVSSFTSVSLDPLLVMVCIAKRLYSHSLIQQSDIFAVNILSAEQVEWGKVFAGVYPDIENRFAGIDYQSAATGSPILPDVLGWLDCSVYRTYDAGDHTIFLGEVLAAEGPGGGEPLMYFSRTWGTFMPLPRDEQVR